MSLNRKKGKSWGICQRNVRRCLIHATTAVTTFSDLCLQHLEYQIIFEANAEMDAAIDELIFATKDMFNYPSDFIPAASKNEVEKLQTDCDAMFTTHEQNGMVYRQLRSNKLKRESDDVKQNLLIKGLTTPPSLGAVAIESSALSN